MPVRNRPEKLIRNNELVENTYTRLSDDDAIPETGDILVSLSMYHEHQNRLQDRQGVGVVIQGSDDPEQLSGILDRIELIAINYPVFSDGRGFSCARLLRERYGYKGELRAVGDVLRDQLFFMARCGFNSFEIRADRNPESAMASLADFNEVYQTGCDKEPAFRRRS